MTNLNSEQITQGLKYIEGVAEYYLVDGDFNNITWLSDGVRPNINQVEAAYELYLQDLDSKEIAENEKKIAVKNKLIELGLTLDDLTVLGL